MSLQRVSPIYDNEAIKSVAQSLINEIQAEAPEVLEKWCTISLYQELGDYTELSGNMAFYKNISRGDIYNATIYVNSENKIRTSPTPGYTPSQEIFYLMANGVVVPNPFAFKCVWLNIIPGNNFMGDYVVTVPGIRYFQQILNTSTNKNVNLNDNQITFNDSEAALYDPSFKFGISTVDSNTINISLIAECVEKDLQLAIDAHNWALIN